MPPYSHQACIMHIIKTGIENISFLEQHDPMFLRVEIEHLEYLVGYLDAYLIHHTCNYSLHDYWFKIRPKYLNNAHSKCKEEMILILGAMISMNAFEDIGMDVFDSDLAGVV